METGVTYSGYVWTQEENEEEEEEEEEKEKEEERQTDRQTDRYLIGSKTITVVHDIQNIRNRARLPENPEVNNAIATHT